MGFFDTLGNIADDFIHNKPVGGKAPSGFKQDFSVLGLGVKDSLEFVPAFARSAVNFSTNPLSHQATKWWGDVSGNSKAFADIVTPPTDADKVDTKISAFQDSHKGRLL